MSDYPLTRGSRSGDPHPTLRLAALIAVIAGVVLVAAAAFLLSYEGIHQIALQAGVSATLARLYPLMFDAMLIVACAATLALRSAGWGSRLYVWACLLLVLAAVAAGDALHATGVRLTGQPARAAIAVIPWVLLLMGFGIWLVMLRHWRRARAAGAAAGPVAASRAGAATGTEASRAATGTEASRAAAGTEASRAGLAAASGAAAAGGTVGWAAGRGATPARAGAPRSGIDELMEPRAGQAPGRPPAADSPAGGKPDAGQEQRRGTPDKKLAAPAGAAGKAGSAAAGPPAGAGQNGTATAGAAAAGPATKAAGIGSGAAVAAGVAGVAGAAAARAAGSARTGQNEYGQDEYGEDATGKEAAGEDATGKEAAGQDSAGQDATGRKATTEEDVGREGISKDNGGKSNGGKSDSSKDNGHKGNGGKDDAEARDRRTRLGGFREVPVSADDEEGSVKILPPKPKAPAQGAAPARDDAALGKDSRAEEAGAPGGEADRAAPAPQPLPAAALAPQFDRLRSSPTPPEDPGDTG